MNTRNMETQRSAKPFGMIKRSAALLAVMVLWLLGSFSALAGPLTINVVGVAPDGSQTPITEYRWTVEEDATKLSIPGQPATPANYSFSFHTSYMPVVAAGRVGDTTRADLNPRLADPDYQRLYAQLPGNLNLDASKRYYVSIATEGFQMGGAPVVFNGSNASATVYLNQYPLPSAQVSVLAFEDNNPLNGGPELTVEQGLAGFTVVLLEAGGTYGQSGGQVTQDGFANPLGTTYNGDGSVNVRGSGIILTGPDGTATIKNLYPAKYTVIIVPPVGSDWHQTSTIEGTRGQDAWIKNNEPSFFQEFGPPGHHVFIGFTRSGVIARNADNSPVLNGTNSITGRVVNIHNSRPPQYSFFNGAPVPECWVGLNEPPPNGRALYTTACKKDSTFTIPNVPNGTYELVVWDDPLDMIMGTTTVTVTGTNVALGDVPVFSWFARYQGRVFQDIDGTGLPFFAKDFSRPYIQVDPVTGLETEAQQNFTAGEIKPPFGAGVANNIRFRDGSIYQSMSTKDDGTFAFTEVFPFFNWMVAEIDYARFRATSMTAVVDGGGCIKVLPTDCPTVPGLTNQEKLWPAEPGLFGSNDPALKYNPWIRLNPQLQQTCSATDVAANTDGDGNIITYAECWQEGDKYYRTESVAGGPGAILLEGIQTFLGMTNHIEWGKVPYKIDENGGIAGIVYGTITRAEDDPRFAAAENWEPGIPRVQVNVFLDCDGDGLPDKPLNDGTGQCVAGASGLSSLGYAYDKPDVDNYPFCWRDPESCGLGAPQKGPEDIKRSSTGLATEFSYGDVLRWGTPGGTPNDQLAIGLGKTDSWDDSIPTGCVRGSTAPVSNGGIPFAADLDCFDGLYNFNQVRGGTVFDGGFAFGRVAGQAELPMIIGEKGDGTYILEAVAPPGYLHQGNGDKNVVFGDQLYAANAALPHECVGMELDVPQFLTLFPGEPNPNYGSPQYPNNKWRKCDMKAVPLVPGLNAAPNFFLFTEAPVAGHGVGFILDDTASEFNRFAPTFGEKYAPPHLPISIQDWTGREISRVYSDQFGSYNFLVPSSFTINPPFPSGVMPSMMVACMNHPGPIKVGVNPDLTDKMGIDPFFNRKYTQFCYTLQYLAGKTTYLDTPVLPIAAFASVEKNPLDCECQDKTPAIYSATNGNNGPWVPGTGGTLTIVSMGAAVDVPNPAYDPTVPGSPKLIARDYSFSSTPGTVRLGTTVLSVVGSWNANILVVNVPNTATTGQLSITRGDNSRESVVGLTVHVGGNAPIVVQPGASIQAAIDAATTLPGDLISIAPGTYNEYVILDKRVRLQGWGAGSVTINAAKSSAGGLAAWRARINAKADVTFSLLPGQALGFDVAGNEPTAFGAEEGPGILAVGKTGADNGCGGVQQVRIDGLTVTGADSGGGILASGYNCNLQISNNRVVSNYGTYGGGIRVGHTTLLDGTDYTDGVNRNVNIHHNWISQNGASEIAAISSGGGGVTLGTGSNNYRVERNYICGNFSMSDGGGIAHIGQSSGSITSSSNPANRIANNFIVLNQTFNQSADPTGGGLFIGGQAAGGGGAATGSGDVIVDANLIQHNHAGAGAGGGVSIALTVNGDDIILTNNMIVNNATAYAGGGVALANAQGVRLVNNTVASNVSTATNRQSFPAGPKVLSNPQIAGIALLSGASPTLLNNIIWGNKSFTWSINTGTDPETTQLAPSAAPNTIWDIGMVPASPLPSAPTYSVLTDTASAPNNAAYSGNNNQFLTAAQVNFVRPIGFVWQTDPDQPVVLPETTVMQTALTFDEGGNFINVIFSPLTPWNPDVSLRGDYHIMPGSLAIDSAANATVANRVPDHDFDGNGRSTTFVDIGADEITSSADLSIAVTNNASYVLQGYPVTYTIVVTNNGSDSVNGALVNVTRPAGIPSWNWVCTPSSPSGCGVTGNTGTGNIAKTLGLLGIGETATFTATGSVSATATGNLVLTATVTPVGAVSDPNMANNSATDSDPIQHAAADLSITKTDGLTTVLRGTTGVTYTVVVTNNGPDPVINATLADTLPGSARLVVTSWTCAPSAGSTCTATGTGNTSRAGVVSLMNGGTAIYTLVGNVPSGAPLGASTNTATITAPSTATDSNTANNTAPDTDTIVGPVLTSVAPGTGVRGSTVPVTLTGTGLAGATGITVSSTGVTCTITGTPTATTVTANCVITAAAGLTTRTMTVTSVTNGSSNTLAGAFTVTAPVLSSVAPSTGLRGTTTPVTLTGSGLVNATGVTVSSTGVSCSITGTPTDTTVTATCVITAAAATTARSVTVTSVLSGSSNTLAGAFTVVAPALTSVAPGTGLRGTTVPVTLTGTNLGGATGVTMSGTGVTCSNIVAAPTSVTADCAITIGATVGARSVTVNSATNGNSNTLAGAFTVQQPALASVAPGTGLRGTTVPVTLTGTNLAGATGVTVSGTLVTCTITGSPTATTVTADCAVAIGAATGARSVTVTSTTNGNSNALLGAFTVQAPALASISPTSGARSTVVPVTLTGTNLAGATGVTMSGTGVTCSGITASPTTVTANCTITAAAALTARNVTVNSTTNGSSNTLASAFTVTP